MYVPLDNNIQHNIVKINHGSENLITQRFMEIVTLPQIWCTGINIGPT